MDKLAQQRGYWNKLREKTNISGRILESINPEFGKMMDKLRASDDRIRQYASELKSFSRDARSYLKQRDYLNAATNLAAFHQRAKLIAAELDHYKSSIDLKHYEFLLSQLDDEYKSQLFGYDPEAKAQLETNEISDGDFNKAAGITDWLVGRTTSDPVAARSSAMKAFEKRFSVPFMMDLKKKSIVMLDSTDKFLVILLTFLKKMATSVATRHIDQYIQLSNDLLKHYGKYHSEFLTFYKKHIVPIKEQHEKLLSAQKGQDQKQEDASMKDLPSVENEQKPFTPGREPYFLPEKEELLYNKKINLPEAKNNQKPFTPGREVSFAPGKEELMYNKQAPGSKNKPFMPGRENPFNTEVSIPLMQKKVDENLPIPLTNKKSHNVFIENIEKYASENDHKALILEMLKYSSELEEIDEEESLGLLAVAEGLIEDYKTAGIFDLFKGKEEQPKSPEKEKQSVPLA